MSGPSTRHKSKRPRGEDTENACAEVLRKIHCTGEITKEDINQIYLIWKPLCHGCRVNSKDSPNCFCGLIPPPNGFRKAGLWQRNHEIISSIGPDPHKDLRPSTETPAGLTNLGATCYANSILQCLYMNTSFRSGIFCLEPDVLKLYPVLDQLAKLFAQLHLSKMAFIDSAPFIKTLELDNGVQQDSHEFLTLFLSLLGQSLSHSKVTNARTVVQDLFRGSVSHVTRCSSCGKESAASSKLEDFYELELNIMGLSNLEESLDDYLSVEELTGENQFYCESCSDRVDATRCIKLRSLPAVLNLQLKRYVFLPKTTTKKKISSLFSFPGKLSMGKRSSNSGEYGDLYDLSAILIHKGRAATSGHYVAHIKDENSGQWWEFDDEHVSNLGSHPFGESSAKSPQTKEQKIQNNCITNGNHENKGNFSEYSLEEDLFSSTDAYMLMYKRIDRDGTISSGMPNVDSSLPLHISTEIEQLNKQYMKACEDYQTEKDNQLNYVRERRQEVKEVLTEAPVKAVEDTYYWISTEWLRQWSDDISPPPCIDNRSIQCQHGKVPFSKVCSMKRLSSTSWYMLVSKYGGGPTMCNDDVCMECLKTEAKSAVSADLYRDQKASLRSLAESALAGTHLDGPLYFISKTWLVQWLRKKNADILDGDPGPTAALRCPHGSLLPERLAKRVSVPESLWLFIFETMRSLNSEDILTFPSDSQSCETCFQELSEVTSAEDNMRSVKLQQRQNHDKLASGKSFAISPGEIHYLVPSSWLAKWRAYITATGKNAFSVPEPESLEATINSVICEKHSRLLERPLELVCKRGVVTQKISATDGLAIISEKDWRLFCEEWNVPVKKGVSAEISFTSSCMIDTNGPCKMKDSSVNKDDICHPVDEENGDSVMEQPCIMTNPEICEDCIGDRASCELMEKLNYRDEDIRVYLIRGKEPPKSIREASASVPELDRRISKRSRRTSSGNSVTLKVSGSTSIYQLKMMIWEAFGVVKENQKIHKGDMEIEDDFSTLADENIFSGDVLWVKDSEVHKYRDIADEISAQKVHDHAEEGFRGSLLASGISRQSSQDEHTGS